MIVAAAVTIARITASAGSSRRARRIQKPATVPARLGVPGHQQVGDEEAAAHEEEVDAEEAAGQLGGALVEADHGEDGQRADPSTPGARARVFVVSPGSTG